MEINESKLVEDAFFRSEDFEHTWMECKNMYEILGFRDQISDEEMIKEFKYIAQQLRKYKFSKQDDVLSCDNYEKMAECAGQMIAKAPEYGNTRAEIVYNFLRDHWLVDMYNTLIQAAGYMNEEDEDA